MKNHFLKTHFITLFMLISCISAPISGMDLFDNVLQMGGSALSPEAAAANLEALTKEKAKLQADIDSLNTEIKEFRINQNITYPDQYDRAVIAFTEQKNHYESLIYSCGVTKKLQEANLGLRKESLFKNNITPEKTTQILQNIENIKATIKDLDDEIDNYNTRIKRVITELYDAENERDLYERSNPEKRKCRLVCQEKAKKVSELSAANVKFGTIATVSEMAKRKKKEADETAEQERKLELAAQDGINQVKKAQAYIEALFAPRNLPFVLGGTTIFFGVPMGFHFLQDALEKPALAIKTSIPSLSEQLIETIRGKKKIKIKTQLTQVIFEEELEKYIKSLTQSYLNSISNGSTFRNVLFYGPPGTGKTAIATTIANLINERASDGMHYIYFAASNLDQFGLEDAIKAINGLFSYAKHSHKKLMIIVDECEVLFANRGGNLSEQARKMLTAFLTFTGAPSRDFVLIGLTNRREAFDTASLSRFYEQVYVGAPNMVQRERILNKYINDYLVCGKNLIPKELTLLQRLLGKKIKRARKLTIEPEALSGTIMSWLHEQLDGFVGRDIENLVIAWQAEAYATKECTLTEDIVRTTTARKVAQRLAEVIESAKEAIKPLL